MIPGISLNLGGTDYVVPPLSLGALEFFQPKLAALTRTLADAPVMGAAIVSALRRNYPELTKEQILGVYEENADGTILRDVPGMVGLENMESVFEAVMDVSGVRRKELQTPEGSPPGEA